MLQRIFFLFAWIAATFSCSPLFAERSELISETTAARHGLTRPWFAQVELDQGRGRVTDVILRDGVLYAQTDSAMVHAIDAETGKTLWSQRIGRPKHPSMTPDARGGLLAVVNGSRLYLVDRFNGKLLHEIAIKDAPGAGPALSSKRVYVPMVSGMVAAYPLSMIDESKRESAKQEKDAEAEEKTGPELDRKASEPPMFCRSYGRVLVQPLVTRDDPGGEYVVWPTDRGYLNFARIDRTIINAFLLKFRMETGARIASRPGYSPPDPKVLGDSGVVYTVSGDGFVYAVREEDGRTLWRFSTGEPIVRSPAVIGDRVYVATQLGGMYCLESKTGENLWWTPGVVQFVAASKARVYVVDRMGRILALDAASGARLDSIPTENISVKMANTDTDRIYLIGRQGLIQCLREAEQTKPIEHNKDPKAAVKPVPEVNPFEDSGDAEPDDSNNPFL